MPGIGAERGGARRWIALGGFSLQPSEFAKLALVLYLARSISRQRERMHEFSAGVVPHAGRVGVVQRLDSLPARLRHRGDPRRCSCC